jgi:hypothetical protein
MLITTIITASLISLICCYLISRAYEDQLDWYRNAWQRQQQLNLFQVQRIEDLEVERERLHEVAIRAWAVPNVEDYFEAGGLEIVTWRN